LALSTVMPFSVVFPLILGMNIGTTTTTIISSIGATKGAKRAAFVHLYYNIIGAFIGLIVVYSVHTIIGFGFWYDDVTPSNIALIQSLYNVACAIAFMPFTKYLERLVVFTIKDKEGANTSDNIESLTKMLDDRFLSTPTIALEQCKNAILNMADVATKNVKLAVGLLTKFSQEDAVQIIENESKLDILDDKISTYIVKLKNLPSRDDKNVSKYLHTIRDFERIGDHAENIMSILQNMNENEIQFSNEGRKELGILAKSVEDILDITMHVLTNRNIELAESVESLEEVVDFLRDTFKERHIGRLKKSGCTVEAAVSYNDIVTDLERIADHCSNIALYIVEEIYESDGVKFETHSYIRQFRESEKFTKPFNAHKDKYLKMMEA